ncbi:MAG TPA: heavy-metal-associated domain-containing protein [Candidatus Gallacutalibacter pullistercoris]|nr:heavy-metal-associated domain-containing protein [Candidatus Gallacutalibacter pullistercoris]
MRKVYRMEELDCANCARKMEDAIRKIEGVENVTVNFLTQKMILQAEDSRFESILQQAIKICRRVEPDCRIIL